MNKLNKFSKRLIPVIVAFAFVTAVTTPANAAQITGMHVNTGDSRVNQSTSHQITVNTSTTAIACVTIRYSSNADGTGTVPVTIGVGANTPAGTFLGSGYSGSRSGGTVTWSKASASAPADNTYGSLDVGDITNGGTPGSYYVTVETFSNQACTTSVDRGAAAFAITEGTQVQAIVDPTLSFTVADNGGTTCNGVTHSGDSTAGATSVNLGRVNTSAVKFDSQNLTVSTNAGGGYYVYARNDGLLRAGSNDVDNWGATRAAPSSPWSAGFEAFGYTSSDGTLSDGDPFGTALFAGMTTSNAEVAYAATGPVNNDTNCIGYRVGVSGNTLAGAYATTVIYTAVPIF